MRVAVVVVMVMEAMMQSWQIWFVIRVGIRVCKRWGEEGKEGKRVLEGIERVRR